MASESLTGSETGARGAQGRLDALASMAADLAGHFELTPLLERILRRAIGLLGCDTGSICTVDEQAGTYRKEADLGVGCQSGRTFPLSEGTTGEIVRRRGVVIFDEYSEVPGGHIAAPERSRLHAVIGVPIRRGGDIIGTCIVFSREPGRRFTDEDATLLELFATHASIAITNAKLHALAADRAREAATMEERARLVRDVHDSVGRELAAVLLHLDEAEADVPLTADGRRILQRARDSVRSALSETRRTALGLGPALLDDRSLAEALALELAWLESTGNMSARLAVIGTPVPVAPESARQLFRVAQESLTNVLEHGHADTVRVGLVYGGETVTLLVEDDGVGFDARALVATSRTIEAKRGFGLRSLIARVHHLGGTARIDSTPGWGTRVRAEIPYEPGIAAPEGDSAARWSVLVVHDHPIMRAGLVRMLSLAEPDIQVVGEIGDSAQVVDAYELLKPDVVLTHLRMPHIDGVRLTSYLRAADPGAAVVLVVDSMADPGVSEAARGGAVGFVTDDIDRAGLARAVLAAARGDAFTAGELFGDAVSPTPVAAARLTARELEVRELIAEGLPYKQIAAALHISVKTVEKHVGAIFRKTGAHSRSALTGRHL